MKITRVPKATKRQNQVYVEKFEVKKSRDLKCQVIFIFKPKKLILGF